MAKRDTPNSRPVTLRHTAKDVKLAEARQATAREELAKGRASVARARAAITRGRETLVSRAKAGELDPVLAPVRVNFDAAEAALNVAVEKLDAAAARLDTAQLRLDEARAKALSVRPATRSE